MFWVSPRHAGKPAMIRGLRNGGTCRARDDRRVVPEEHHHERTEPEQGKSYPPIRSRRLSDVWLAINRGEMLSVVTLFDGGAFTVIDGQATYSRHTACGHAVILTNG